MKKLFFLLTVAATMIISCGKNESHYTEVYYPTNRSLLVMADQTADSLIFASTDSWTLTSNADWCTFDSEYKSYTNKYENTWVQFSVPLTFTPNRTGKVRDAVVLIDGGQSTNAAYYVQVPYLGISRPMRFVSNETLMPTEILTLNLTASSVADSVAFVVYGDWTLQALQGQWLTPSATSGRKGTCKVFLDIDSNTTEAERRDTLLLTSNGVMDSIFVVQQAKVVTTTE
jgi:hypothetical protein